MANRLPLAFVASDHPTEGRVELDNGDFICIGTTDWYNWLQEQGSFRFESGIGGRDSFTARKRKRDSGDFWYAYRKLEGRLSNIYLGKSEALNVPKLLEVAAKIQEPPQPKLDKTSYTQPSTTDNRLDKGSYTQPGTTEAIEALRQEIAGLKIRMERLESLGKQMA